ncbi:hypothetical protein PLANPX_5737 [Lacipirellula parvula]|uniref:Uncharacterized protein n=1 Tax=Lacipirellula parvula TaxID=2650471 RepID=A0A5K7XIA2_9BACT|nr:hypothetical protein PLANPX_5737 [Lacipirellula parvula]
MVSGGTPIPVGGNPKTNRQGRQDRQGEERGQAEPLMKADKR